MPLSWVPTSQTGSSICTLTPGRRAKFIVDEGPRGDAFLDKLASSPGPARPWGVNGWLVEKWLPRKNLSWGLLDGGKQALSSARHTLAAPSEPLAGDEESPLCLVMPDAAPEEVTRAEELLSKVRGGMGTSPSTLSSYRSEV